MSKIVWTSADQISKDDFISHPEKDYCLRVEWMDGDDWWWRVYYKDEVVADSYDNTIDGKVHSGKSEYHAKELCENAFKKHLNDIG